MDQITLSPLVLLLNPLKAFCSMSPMLFILFCSYGVAFYQLPVAGSQLPVY
jgi:hypothetical protein